jgi:hypothetical protein
LLPLADYLLRLYGALEKMEKNMGLGALARAQVLQAQAGATRDVVEVRAARERMRQRLLNQGGDSPA